MNNCRKKNRTLLVFPFSPFPEKLPVERSFPSKLLRNLTLSFRLFCFFDLPTIARFNFFQTTLLPCWSALNGDIFCPVSIQGIWWFVAVWGGGKPGGDLKVPTARDQRLSCRLRSEPPDVPEMSLHQNLVKYKNGSYESFETLTLN